MKPPSILDPSFKYVPAASTDLKKTFARVRREQREAAARVQAKDAKVVAVLRAGFHPHYTKGKP